MSGVPGRVRDPRIDLGTGRRAAPWSRKPRAVRPLACNLKRWVTVRSFSNIGASAHRPAEWTRQRPLCLDSAGRLVAINGNGEDAVGHQGGAAYRLKDLGVTGNTTYGLIDGAI